MESWQRQELSLIFQEAHGRIFCIGKWNNEDISDPYRQGQDRFEEVFKQIKANWQIWQSKIW